MSVSVIIIAVVVFVVFIFLTSFIPVGLWIAAIAAGVKVRIFGDLVAMRVVVAGERDGARTVVTYEMLDFQDNELGVTAMMRTTGYSLAGIARLQASGAVRPGVHTAAECVPVNAYVGTLAECGVKISRTES